MTDAIGTNEATEHSTLADIYACRGSHSLYRSPLRLSVSMVHDVTGIGLDLDCTEIGDWRPEKVYAFHAALPEGFVRHHLSISAASRTSTNTSCTSRRPYSASSSGSTTTGWSRRGDRPRLQRLTRS